MSYEYAAAPWNNSLTYTSSGHSVIASPQSSITQLVHCDEKLSLRYRCDPDTDEELEEDNSRSLHKKETQSMKSLSDASKLELFEENLVSPITEFSPSKQGLMFKADVSSCGSDFWSLDEHP